MVLSTLKTARPTRTWQRACTTCSSLRNLPFQAALSAIAVVSFVRRLGFSTHACLGGHNNARAAAAGMQAVLGAAGSAAADYLAAPSRSMGHGTNSTQMLASTATINLVGLRPTPWQQHSRARVTPGAHGLASAPGIGWWRAHVHGPSQCIHAAGSHASSTDASASARTTSNSYTSTSAAISSGISARKTRPVGRSRASAVPRAMRSGSGSRPFDAYLNKSETLEGIIRKEVATGIRDVRHAHACRTHVAPPDAAVAT